MELLNSSINQTLSRTINSQSPLFFRSWLSTFGRRGAQELLLCPLGGILVGTYSSIFLASGLLAEWWNKVPQKADNYPQYGSPLRGLLFFVPDSVVCGRGFRRTAFNVEQRKYVLYLHNADKTT